MIFAIFVLALFVAGLLTPVAIFFAEILGAWDLPSDKKLHQRPITRIGGLAVIGGVVVGLLIVIPWSPALAGLMAGGSLIYLLGFWEDVRGLPASVRLAGQFAAALITVFMGLSVPHVPGWVGAGYLEPALAVLWLVAVTNALNMIDGIDGLAGSTGWLASVLFMSIALLDGDMTTASLAAALAGACFGFLPYNWNGALVFLGDSGAHFIGFLLGGLGLMSLGGETTAAGVIVPFLILGVPLLDLTWTYGARIFGGAGKEGIRRLLEFTGQDHIHHRLIQEGLTAPEAVCVLSMLTFSLGFAAALVRVFPEGLWPAALFGAVVLFATGWMLRPGEPDRGKGPGGAVDDELRDRMRAYFSEEGESSSEPDS